MIIVRYITHILLLNACDNNFNLLRRDALIINV